MTIIHFHLLTLIFFFVLGYLLGKPSSKKFDNAVEELSQLKGVGEKTARRVVDYMKEL